MAAADTAGSQRWPATVRDQVFCEYRKRKVGRDWRRTPLQIDEGHASLNLPGKGVTLQDRPGGTIPLLWQYQSLRW